MTSPKVFTQSMKVIYKRKLKINLKKVAIMLAIITKISSIALLSEDTIP